MMWKLFSLPHHMNFFIPIISFQIEFSPPEKMKTSCGKIRSSCAISLLPNFLWLELHVSSASITVRKISRIFAQSKLLILGYLRWESWDGKAWNLFVCTLGISTIYLNKFVCFSFETNKHCWRVCRCDRLRSDHQSTSFACSYICNSNSAYNEEKNCLLGYTCSRSPWYTFFFCFYY